MGHLPDRRVGRAALALLTAVLVTIPVATGSASVPESPVRPAPVRADGQLPSINLRGDVHQPRQATDGRQAYRSWPGRTIRFHSSMDPTFDWVISAAVGAWNRSGVDMTFKQVRSKRRAQLLIRPTRGSGISGEATLGYNPFGQQNNWVKLSRDALKPSRFTEELTPWMRQIAMANILGHELGHTLGIGHQPQHETKCGLMMPSLKIGTCDLTGAEMGYYACGMTDSWVLLRTVRKYGGRRTSGVATCPILPIPPAPAGLRISGGFEEDRPIQVDWTPPGTLPPGTMMHIRESSGYWCPARTGRDDYLWPTWADPTYEEYFVDPQLGTWRTPDDAWNDDHELKCYTARLANDVGGSDEPVSLARTPWYPPPAKPTVLSVVSFPGSDDYVVKLSPADMADYSLEFFGFAYPTGQCGTEPITLAEVEASHPSTNVRTTFDNPCLRIVALRGKRVSEPTSWQVS